MRARMRRLSEEKMSKRRGNKGGVPLSVSVEQNPTGSRTDKPTWIERKAHNKPIDEAAE
jgi:hypothetical protein